MNRCIFVDKTCFSGLVSKGSLKRFAISVHGLASQLHMMNF